MEKKANRNFKSINMSVSQEIYYDFSELVKLLTINEVLEGNYSQLCEKTQLTNLKNSWVWRKNCYPSKYSWLVYY